MPPLLAVLLVASSSRGANIVFSWPPRPRVKRKHTQVRVDEDEDQEELVREWSDSSSDASLSGSEESDSCSSERSFEQGAAALKHEVEERRTRHDIRGSRFQNSDVGSSRSPSVTRMRSRAPSFARMPRRMEEDAHSEARRNAELPMLFDFDQGVLAGILSPKPEQCHGRFELGIDNLTFIGHPVSAGPDGRWGNVGMQNSNGVSQFNLVMVLERPDPQVLPPGLDLAQWTNTYYALAFKVTAALYGEEVRAWYVSMHVAMLNELRDECAQHGGTHRDYLRAAIAQSSLAELIYRMQRAMGRARNAFVTVNDHIDLHLQLPPLLLDPARAERLREVQHVIDPVDPLVMRGDTAEPSAPRLHETAFQEWTNSTGPFLLPWKTLLLPEDFSNPNGAHASLYALTRPFADLFEPTLQGARTFAQAAEQLNWDLYTRVYPMARHLIYYGKARVVDVPRTQAMYTIDPTFTMTDIDDLAARWRAVFPMMRALPQFLADMTATLRPFVSHFAPRTNRALILDVLVWLLRNRVVIQMHVHLRLVATERDQERAVELCRKHAESRKEREQSDDSDSDDALQRLIETLRQKQPQQLRMPQSSRAARSHSTSQSSSISTVEEFTSIVPPLSPASPASPAANMHLSVDDGDAGELIPAGAPRATFIVEPRRATRVENEWIAAMLDGKHPWYTRWFLRLLPYLNGKHTIDEIIARERVGRRDLRLVLTQFQHNLVRFVHP